MTGSTVVAYHLVGADGSQMTATKERIIYMIGKGMVENMRLQVNGDDMILRGKGVNLNMLPVFDTEKGDFRGNQASQNAATTSVSPKKNSGVNPMGQLRITMRMMFKTSCIGYVVVDHSGQEKKLSRNRVMELASQKLISNAVIQNYTPTNGGPSQVILRGVECDLGSLPVIAVDANGKVINGAVRNEEYVYMRTVKMRRGGVIYDNNKNIKLTFEPGDYILCGINAVLRPVKGTEAEKLFTSTTEVTSAECDKMLDNLNNYPIELFGAPSQCLNASQVMRWQIVKVKKS